ncbi:hypothetical protein [Marinococcus sp. PL1-022]|uniref:hypothetical protein n=1 Tax=Marinococcus sp. PL1-022 TaxID=3095363 RepID=UPI0029C4C6A7|nr:hypothetical protein [Marinococcus sp. PL1-022]MDX6154322.1 hypothetical protein [Marinococcus sp. PL1-022]
MITLVTLKLFIDRPLKSQPNDPITILALKEKDGESLNYIVTYIIPFISFNTEVFSIDGSIDIPKLVAFLILFLVIGSLYMYNNLYYINPVLIIFYDIYKIESADHKDAIFIIDKNSKPEDNRKIYVRNIYSSIYLQTDKKNKLTFFKIIIFAIFLLFCLFIWNEKMQTFVFEMIKFIFCGTYF